LQNGALGTTNAIDSNIESVGNGWYRCSVSFNTSNQRVYIYPAEANSTTGTTGSIYIQSAQLEIGLAATDYIESGATTGKAGLLEDEPRFDYSGGATCPSLLLEPSRTNLVPYSEYFDAYTKSDTSILTNQAQSPEGLVNASLIAETATNSNHYLGLTSGISVVSGTTYTFSVFIKKGDGASAPDYCQLTFNSAGFGAIYANFNLSNGTIGTLSGVTPLISDSTINGFWRCSITATATSTANTGAIVAFTNNNDSLGRLPSYLGNTASDFYAYGFQVEQGSYPTSYIPNHSGGSVTRGADDCITLGLGSIAGQSEGTLFAYFETIGDSGTPYISLNQNNGVTNRVLIYNNTGVSTEVRSGGIVQASITSTTQGLVKAAFAYKENDFAFYLNGSQVGTDTSGSTFGAGVLNELNLGFVGQDGAEIKQVLLFDTRLSNTDLATLTTL
jgi:hypothetical protein